MILLVSCSCQADKGKGKRKKRNEKSSEIALAREESSTPARGSPRSPLLLCLSCTEQQKARPRPCSPCRDQRRPHATEAPHGAGAGSQREERHSSQLTPRLRRRETQAGCSGTLRRKGRYFTTRDTGQGKCFNSACQIKHLVTHFHPHSAHKHSSPYAAKVLPPSTRTTASTLKPRKATPPSGMTAERKGRGAGEGSPAPRRYPPVLPPQHRTREPLQHDVTQRLQG